MLLPQLLVARYLDSNIPGTASQVCILLWAEFPWIFPGPGVTNEGWQQLISYQINDRQAFQLLHSPHSLSTSGPCLMFLTGMMEMICMLHSDWHHYTEMVSTRTQQTNKMLACDGWLSRITGLFVCDECASSCCFISRYFFAISLRAGLRVLVLILSQYQ